MGFILWGRYYLWVYLPPRDSAAGPIEPHCESLSLESTHRHDLNGWD